MEVRVLTLSITEERLAEIVSTALRQALEAAGHGVNREPDRLRTTAEALEFLGLKGRSSISALVTSGQITAIRAGRGYRFRQSDLDAYAAAHTTKPPRG